MNFDGVFVNSIREICLVGEIDSDFFNGTVEDFAKLIYGIGINIAVIPQTIQLTSTKVIVFEQLVLRNAFSFHGIPEWVK